MVERLLDTPPLTLNHQQHHALTYLVEKIINLYLLWLVIYLVNVRFRTAINLSHEK